MFNPVTFSLKLQQAAFEACAAASNSMIANYVHLVEQQNRLLHHGCIHHRGDDFDVNSSDVVSPKKGRSAKKSPCHGPDLLDHYGKRAYDVDPEHI